jgi:hypothetical protein
MNFSLVTTNKDGDQEDYASEQNLTVLSSSLHLSGI